MKALVFTLCALALCAGCGGSATIGGGAGGASSGSGSGSAGSGGGTGSTGSTGLGTSGSSGGGVTSAGSGGSTGSTSGDLCSTQSCVVYAQTASQLYTINPADPASSPTRLCTFGGDINGAAINDIAVDASGVLYALSASALFRVTLTPDASGSCPSTKVTDVAGSQNYNALSFTLDGTLLAAGSDGAIAEIDLAGGSSSVVGAFATGYGSSGDFVALSDGRIFATAQKSGVSDDILVQIGESGGRYSQVAVIGNVGYPGVYGLGFWAGTLYGFDSAGDVLTIDPNSGHATAKGNIGQRWYGAGTTPLAPTFQ